MRKVILCFIVFIICCCNQVTGQITKPRELFLFALEPNIGLGNRVFKGSNPQTNINSKNILGIGLSIGYQLEWDHFFTNARLGFNTFRNAVVMDFPASGINDSSRIQYEKSDYGFEYSSSIGLALNGGYKLKVFNGNALYLGIGLQSFYAVQTPATNGIDIYTGNGAGNNVRSVYYEQVTNKPSFTFGTEALINYAFYLGRARLLAGLRYVYVPVQQIKGNYIAYAGMPAEDKGTFEINRSYACFTLGIMTSR